MKRTTRTLNMRKGDIHKCYFFLILGVLLFIIGIPIVTVGIVLLGNKNIYGDFIAYVGGLSMFFGILFVFWWYMITIPTKEELKKDGPKVDGIANRGFIMDESASTVENGNIKSTPEKHRKIEEINKAFGPDCSSSSTGKKRSEKYASASDSGSSLQSNDQSNLSKTQPKSWEKEIWSGQVNPNFSSD